MLRVLALVLWGSLLGSIGYTQCAAAPVGTANDPVLQMRLNGDGKSGLGPANALSSNEEGAVVWDDSSDELVFCDGTNWVNMGGGGIAVETDPQVGSTTLNNWCRGSGSQVACDQAAPVRTTGSTMTGALTLSGAPTNSNHAATKAYVDSEIASSGGGTTETVIYNTALPADGTPVALSSLHTFQTGDRIYFEGVVQGNFANCRHTLGPGNNNIHFASEASGANQAYPDPSVGIGATFLEVLPLFQGSNLYAFVHSPSVGVSVDMSSIDVGVNQPSSCGVNQNMKITVVR